MRILTVLLSLALVANASSWFSTAAYNKWHKTELEQWLSDHNVPYPTSADRKQLQDLVQSHWSNYVLQPYNQWDSKQLAEYLRLQGETVQDAAEQSKDGLVSRVKALWKDGDDTAQTAYLNVKDWILDSWTDSQLKAFCDHHGIPVPQPRTRDTLLQKARSGYETVAKKANQASAYPGNWLYETWSDSDLKEWLDEHGIPVPQPSQRDKLIATVRRNSYLAYRQAQDKTDQLRKTSQNVFDSLSDSVLNTWSDSELKRFCEKNGIPVPKGSKTDELRALVRRQRALAMGDTASAHAWSLFGAATTRAGNEYAKATDTASQAARAAFDAAVDSWSESRLKGFLEARGVPLPHATSVDKLRALVRENAHKAATATTSWSLDDFSPAQLRDYLQAAGGEAAAKAADQVGVTHDDLVAAAQAAYSAASRAGSEQFAAATSYLSAATQAARDNMFDTWSESDLKAYLDTYGVPVPQGSTANELRAYARQQATYFRYGTLSPTQTWYAKAAHGLSSAASGLWGYVDWVQGKLGQGTDAAKEQAETVRQKLDNEL